MTLAIVSTHLSMVTLLAMVLLLLLLLHLLLVMIAALLLLLLSTASTAPHPNAFAWRLTIAICHVCSTSSIVPRVLPSIPISGLVLLLLIILREELSFRIGNWEVAEYIRSWVWLLLEVTVCHGCLAGETLGGVHNQEFLK